MALAVDQIRAERGFSPYLGWSHYRTSMNVENHNERLFYEIEAENESRDVEHLKHQIHTFLFARLLKSLDKAGVMKLAGQGQKLSSPADTIPFIP
jgi:predicted nuclease of restriction endonuclease-like (RecB) superfamily